MKILFPLLLLALPLRAAETSADEEALDVAVRTEIARATSTLRVDDNPAPYFIAARVADAERSTLRCVLGGLGSRVQSAERELTVDLRVGSPQLDNHPAGPWVADRGRQLPRDGDVKALRHMLWVQFDRDYRGALSGWLGRKAQRVRKGKADYECDDLAPEPPHVLVEPAPAAPRIPAQGGEALCRTLSAGMRRPQLTSSEVILSEERGRRRLWTSEGTRLLLDEGHAALTLYARALSREGTELTLNRSFLAPDADRLPSAQRLRAEAAGLLEDIDALRAAPSTAPFNAPALLDPSVAAAVLEAFSARLSGEEQRDPAGAQTFGGKLGARVAPAFLTLVDDPTLSEYRGRALLGGYRADDEGVPARAVTLIEKGRLRNYLLSRYPLSGALRSNGHGRAASGRLPKGRASNLFLRPARTLSRDALLARLRALCRARGLPYGLWIQRRNSWTQRSGTSGRQSFRLVPTRVYLVDAASGARTLVRDLDLVGTPLALIERVAEAGDDYEVVDSELDRDSGRLPMSVVTPSLLLSEAELQSSSAKPERPPVLPAPGF
ncbi:MAG: metallopeptidase TldD-related protein [Elusimicrobiota bacterium]|jgi:predicted Zn-dependent protease